MQEKAKIFKLLMSEIKTYPNPQITPEGLGMIAERLDKRYSYEQVEKAMNAISYKARFFPSLAEIVDQIEKHEPALKVLSWDEERAKREEQYKKDLAYMNMLEEMEKNGRLEGTEKQ